MIDLDSIQKNIEGRAFPPVENWDPEFCGDIDIVIKKDGRWIHEGSEIKRAKLVKLFASVLRKDDEDYYLVTPVEKVKIRVEDCPFRVVSVELIDSTWVMTNNLGEKQLLNTEQQLNSAVIDHPFVYWRRNLPATVSQSVMYQWQIHALDAGGLIDDQLWLQSGNTKFLIGQV